ncbi:MAG TPA: XRE family transcriptional regulator [Treponema sp.]|jgi:transcriptional regulator with XRE-family HTH domain|nr:helix-turn-helix transcriptional regulator [Treponema sp.]HBB43002.1 XRE family transcriptional regulator [Treponema sp.]HCA20181.1 XRE family transcriptional regulator [Treponema sp.]
MGFKERLRDEIEYRGLLVKEVSAAIGISNSTFLSYIDARGVLPNVETAVRIAKYLGVSVEYLVDGDEETQDKLKNPPDAGEDFMNAKRQLLDSYDRLTGHDKAVLLKIAKAMSSQ